MGNSGKTFICILASIFLGMMLPCLAAANTMNGSMDYDKTVAGVTDTSPEDGSTEMTILTREGTSYSLSGTSTWDVNEMDSPGPHWFRGTVIVTNGNYTMNGIDSEGSPQSGSGTISIQADGTVSITIPTQLPFQCHLDSGYTVMACTRTQDENSSMLVMTKRAASNSISDLAHTWDLNVLSSPGPSWMRGTIIIGSDGYFLMAGTDNDGDPQNATGSTSINGSDGVIFFTPNGQDAFPCTLDAGKTVMACTKSSSGPSSDLVIMTRRAPSYSSADLTGVWHSHSLATGASQWWSTGTLTFGAGGFFSGSGTGSYGSTWDTSGKATISASGALAIQTDDFTATPRTGGAPLIVNFTDATVHNPTSWLWQFDDGTTSTEQNPVHIFTSEGSYDVSLTAITAGVQVFVTKTGFINALPCVVLPVYRVGHYTLISDGCNTASANGQTVETHAVTFIQDPTLTNTFSIKLQGGYDCEYSANPGWTTINGKLTIKGKPVIVEKIKIR